MASESAAAPLPPTADRLLDGLTAEQAQAVRHGPGVLLIVAGPGSGKTRTLIHRIAWLLEQRLAEPRKILAVTFSVRAASELRLRLADLLGEQAAAQVTAATFHSICARLLREHPELVGRGGAFTIYDQVEVRRVLEWLLSDRQRTEIQQALADFGRPASSEVLHEISLAKNRLLTPESYEQGARHPAGPLIAAVWRETDAELRRSNAMDFDDLLVCAVRLLSEHPHYLELYRRRWPWILVDEWQDTCQAQAVLVSLLAGTGNLWCVGDDDQTVYSWRGADPRGLSRLAERFPSHERIVLARNFRSHAEIVSAATRSIQHNPDRLPKTLIAMRGAGGQANAIRFGSEREEASWIASTAAQELEAGTAPTEILLLARTGYANDPVQTALAAAGIPYRVLGSLGLYERSEVRDALAYLTLIANPADAQAFRRSVSAPRRGVGERIAGQVVARARESHEGDLIATTATAGLTRIGTDKVREQLERFGRGLERARCELATGRSLGHVAIATVTLPAGLVAHYQALVDQSADAGVRRDAERVLEDLRSLCRAVQAYEEREDSPTLAGFLEHARGLHARELRPGEEDRRITVSTIHCSPPDERIATKRGAVPIAHLEPSDRLISYHRSTNTIFGNSWHGSARGYPFRRSVRAYDGNLVVIETLKTRTRVTPDHRVVVRLAEEAFSDRWVVYLMRRGDWWRAGICTTFHRGPYVSGGLNGRLATEQANEGWILSVHDNRKEALVAEATVQGQYGIPGRSFRPATKTPRNLGDVELAHIHSAVSGHVAPRALRLLSDTGLSPDSPLYRRGALRQNFRGYFVTEAANLLPLSNRIEMLTLGVGNKGVPARACVSREHYCGPVYGLDVPPYHYYVSGGAVVHNSAKGTEAALVILAGCEERLLPSWRSLETPEQLHEERRLFYVACTRAKGRLYVTHAATRGGRPTGGPSRFLAEAGLIGPAAPAA